MVSKHKALVYSYDVLFVILILEFQTLENRGFNQPLFVKPLFVPQYFKGDCVTCFMVKALKYLTEGPFADLPLNLETVRDVVSQVADVLLFVIVKSIVLWTTRRFQPLTHVDVVDSLVTQNFLFFKGQ